MRSRREFLCFGVRTIGLLGIAAGPVAARAAEGATSDELTDKAVGFLRPRQADDGSWSGNRKEPGITALVVTALLRSRRVSPDEPTATRAFAYLEKFIGPKGGLAESAHSNYSTSIALMAFQEGNKVARYDGIIKGGQAFLKSAQWDESEGKAQDSDYYGGAGYGGGNSRPDLSNTAFMLEALHDTGLPADDPALKKALVFVSRCQNFKSEFNDRPWAGKVNDGGFIYTAANGGSSDVGKTENGGLRSYAAMTYAGLKSMIYAGLAPDDPRVKAAYDYITKHYTVAENPGLGQRGLYYFYQAFARALAVVGKPKIVDANGQSHDWRAELVEALARRQNANGSWVNQNDSLMEGDPNLVTAYALLALNYARPKG